MACGLGWVGSPQPDGLWVNLWVGLGQVYRLGWNVTYKNYQYIRMTVYFVSISRNFFCNYSYSSYSDLNLQSVQAVRIVHAVCDFML